MEPVSTAEDPCCLLCYLKLNKVERGVPDYILQTNFDIVWDLEKEKIDDILSVVSTDKRAKLLEVFTNYVTNYGLKEIPICHRGFTQLDSLPLKIQPDVIATDFTLEDGHIIEVFYTKHQSIYAYLSRQELVKSSMQNRIEGIHQEVAKKLTFDKTILFSSFYKSIYKYTPTLEGQMKSDRFKITSSTGIGEMFMSVKSFIEQGVRLFIIDDLGEMTAACGKTQNPRVKEFVDACKSTRGTLDTIKIVFFMYMPVDTTMQKFRQLVANVNYGLEDRERSKVYIINLNTTEFQRTRNFNVQLMSEL